MRCEPGLQLAFCRRNAETARADLTRICAEIREELEPSEMEYAPAAGPPVAPAGERKRMVGAVYVSCVGRRRRALWLAARRRMQIVRQALGDVPMVGFLPAAKWLTNTSTPSPAC
jgi:small ligand-binding sensory domain FIST